MSDTEQEKQFKKYLRAKEAEKDIVYMYYALLCCGNLHDDLGDDEEGTFDPFVYINCTAEETGLDVTEVRLLHEGSAIKLACIVLRNWGQNRDQFQDSPYINRIRTLVYSDRVDHLPELKALIIFALNPDDEVWAVCRKIYVKYVRGHFARLIDLTDKPYINLPDKPYTAAGSIKKFLGLGKHGR